MKFQPNYNITREIAGNILRIEKAKKESIHFPLTPTVLSSLRESAQLYTTHYSTMIEGNQLAPKEVEAVLKKEEHFPGRAREEHEIKGYYAALKKVEEWAAEKKEITEQTIQTLHALVMGNGRIRVKPTPYRDGQNVIRDSRTRAIVYMPPEAKDVSALMISMVDWIDDVKKIPTPIVAGLVHYQFATIHPYYDGNGRTARLLTTLVLHLGGYDLKGLYSLEEYYARHLHGYYEAIGVGASHNYYEGRAKRSVTPWLNYFIAGMADSFEKVIVKMKDAQEKGNSDQSAFLRKLDARQRKALKLFQKFEAVTSQQIGALFDFKPRTSTHVCAVWVQEGFLEAVGSSNKNRKYKLTPEYECLIF
ncbi:MAG: Fic family protein [Chthoniobacterales bacterium]|nr:Fic family protein [Chthoniobacterales bacterium]